jgi:hypothetical protein
VTQSSNPRSLWTFKKIGPYADPDPTTETRNLAEQEMAKRKEAEAGLEIAKEEPEQARNPVQHETHKREEAEAALAVAGERAEQETRKREKAEAALAAAGERETARRERAEAELKKAKEDQTRAENLAAEEMRKREKAEATLAVVGQRAEQEMAKRREAEVELVIKAAELRQTKEELAEIRAKLESSFIITPQLNTGRYTRTNVATHRIETGLYIITNVGTHNVATLASAKTGSYVAGGVEQDEDTEKVWTYPDAKRHHDFNMGSGLSCYSATENIRYKVLLLACTQLGIPAPRREMTSSGHPTLNNGKSK